MRTVVVTEGVPLWPRGITILPGALYVEKDQIPVCLANYWTEEGLVAFAKDFERNEETGEISFDIEWRDELTEEAQKFYDEHFEKSLFCSDVEEKPGLRDNRIIFKAHIRQISLIANATYPVGHNPGARLDG